MRQGSRQTSTICLNDVQVLYVPTAKALIEGGTFQQHAEGGWDNPENARLLLASLLHHDEAQLRSMPAPQQPSSARDDSSGPPEAAISGSSSLADVARAAMDPQQDHLPVQAVLDIVSHALEQEEVCSCRAPPPPPLPPILLQGSPASEESIVP